MRQFGLLADPSKRFADLTATDDRSRFLPTTFFDTQSIHLSYPPPFFPPILFVCMLRQ